MCGVFGFVSDGDRNPNMKRLATIAKATETRGRHAFGFAWIDSVGRLRCFKQRGRISDHLGLLSMAADARILIGHCRYATQGDPASNLNNHPHPVDGGWFVHNGQIPLYRVINESWGLHSSTDCDSESIGLLIEVLEGTLLERCAAAVTEIGENPAVVAALWSKPRRLVMVRRKNPLRIGHAATGTYFASLRPGLPRDARMMKDRTALLFTLGDRHGPTKRKTIPIPEAVESAATLFDDDGPADRTDEFFARETGDLLSVPNDEQPEALTGEIRRGAWFE